MFLRKERSPVILEGSTIKLLVSTQDLITSRKTHLDFLINTMQLTILNTTINHTPNSG